MPTYEYACLECSHTYDVRASMSEKERGLKPVCPKCRSAKAERVIGPVMSVTKRDRGGPSSPCCGPNCCPGR